MTFKQRRQMLDAIHVIRGTVAVALIGTLATAHPSYLNACWPRVSATVLPAPSIVCEVPTQLDSAIDESLVTCHPVMDCLLRALNVFGLNFQVVSSAHFACASIDEFSVDGDYGVPGWWLHAQHSFDEQQPVPTR